jgi:hypothetical protein
MRNIPSVLYALAAVIWLVVGFLTGSVVYIALAAVFFLLAYRKRSSKEE